MKTKRMLCMSGAIALAMGWAVVQASGPVAPEVSRPEVSAVTVTTSAAPLVTVVLPSEMPVDCLNAFSKDLCDGFMHPGFASFGSCPFLPTPCKTVTVTQATLVVPLKRNETLCASDGKCDETPETDGTLKVAMEYELRLHKPCPFRGCWNGKWAIETVTGARFEGEAMGTLGVGTNRKFVCPQHRNDFCERCLDVQFIPTAIGGVWRIAMEGAFQGRRVDAETGERLCFTVNADWYLAGDANGPFDFSGNFKVYGTADGIHAVPCGF